MRLYWHVGIGRWRHFDTCWHYELSVFIVLHTACVTHTLFCGLLFITGCVILSSLVLYLYYIVVVCTFVCYTYFSICIMPVTIITMSGLSLIKDLSLHSAFLPQEITAVFQGSSQFIHWVTEWRIQLLCHPFGVSGEWQKIHQTSCLYILLHTLKHWFIWHTFRGVDREVMNVTRYKASWLEILQNIQ